MRERINWKKIIKAGNEVKVRQWDDMIKEYDVYYGRGNDSYPFNFIQIIDCTKKFTEDMKKFCGKTIKIDEDMEKDFNIWRSFFYEDYAFSTDMLEPYSIFEEEKEEKEITAPNIENYGIKENSIYVIEYDDTEGKTFLGENNFITFKGKIINFTNDKCFIVDEKKGLAILDVKNIISMIPIKVN